MADQSNTPSPDTIREERAYALGTAAYLWGFTMNELYRVRSHALSKAGATVNTFLHSRTLLTPEAARQNGVVRANSATLYSSAWLDLSVEPMVLDLPAISDRYFTMNHVDYYQRNENISNATVGRRGGVYAFVGPNWKGTLPEKLHRVKIATDTVWIVGRIEVKGPDDVENVNRLQDTLTLTSLREWIGGRRNTIGGNIYDPWPPYDVSNPLSFFALLNEGLKRNPPQGSDLVMLGLLESLNIGPNKTFDPMKLDLATAAGLTRAVEIGPSILAADFKERLGQSLNNWQIATDLGSWQTPDSDQIDFVLRSAIAKEAQPGQHATEAIYPMAFSDAQGMPLTGANRCVLRFPKGELPPVNAFWSLTLYDAAGFTITSAINRTQIGTYNRLLAEADGSTVVYIQHETPGKDKESNWLPAPEGLFNLALRLYNAGPAALTLDWVPPAVQRV